MSNGSPERLLGSNYLNLSSPYRMFKHFISNDNKIPTHWHDFFEMACIVSGAGTHVVNGQPFRIKPGMVFLLTTADFHELLADEGETVELYNFIFDDSFIRPAIQEAIYGQSRLFLHTFEGEPARRMEEEFARIWEESQHMRFGNDIVVQGCLERIVIQLVRQLESDRADEREQERIRKDSMHPSIHKALLFIQHRFREPITLAVAADYAGLSPNYFSECFRKQVGLSFQDYLNDKRLQFASALLRSSDLPVTEVCYAAGYNTILHFDRLFKRKFGSSPREYRKLRG